MSPSKLLSQRSLDRQQEMTQKLSILSSALRAVISLDAVSTQVRRLVVRDCKRRTYHCQPQRSGEDRPVLMGARYLRRAILICYLSHFHRYFALPWSLADTSLPICICVPSVVENNARAGQPSVAHMWYGPVYDSARAPGYMHVCRYGCAANPAEASRGRRPGHKTQEFGPAVSLLVFFGHFYRHSGSECQFVGTL